MEQEELMQFVQWLPSKVVKNFKNKTPEGEIVGKTKWISYETEDGKEHCFLDWLT